MTQGGKKTICIHTMEYCSDTTRTNPKSFINWTPVCITKKILSNCCHVTTFLCHQKQKQKNYSFVHDIHHDQKHLLLWLKTTRWCHITNIPRNKGLCHQVDKEISRRLSWKFILATALQRTDIHLFSQSMQRVSRKTLPTFFNVKRNTIPKWKVQYMWQAISIIPDMIFPLLIKINWTTYVGWTSTSRMFINLAIEQFRTPSHLSK